MSYVIGIDGGGTKTTCLFSSYESASPNSQSSERMLTGKGTNPHIVGFREMGVRLENLIREGLSNFSIEPEKVTAVCCGLAGVGRKEDEIKALAVLEEMSVRLKLKKDCLFDVHSDTYIALRGAMHPETNQGILVISGTGSNAMGIDSGNRVYKSGGWGHLLGDEGSGYQIGLQALNRVTRAFDKRGKETKLTELILSELELKHPKQLVSYIYSSHLEKKDIARFARLVIEAAAESDAVSIELLKNAAYELSLHVESLFHMSSQFNEESPITTTGSIFTYSEILRNQFIRNITERNLGIYQQAYSTPAYGAAVIARELQLR